MRYGLKLLLNHNDVIDYDFQSSVDEESDFDVYETGSDCVEEELARIVASLPEANAFDFVLTTHDGVYFRDFKTRAPFEGDLDIE